MLPDDARGSEAIHATAVAIDGLALVILGPSRSGKSTLAAALMASSHRQRRIKLIGDDRVILTARRDGDLVVQPHPRIAGFIERRGLGLVAVAHRASAPAAGIVDLGVATRRPIALHLPVLALARVMDLDRRRDLVCRWWPAVRGAALGSHAVAKTALTAASAAKQYSW